MSNLKISFYVYEIHKKKKLWGANISIPITRWHKFKSLSRATFTNLKQFPVSPGLSDFNEPLFIYRTILKQKKINGVTIKK